jgi:hypothetical protein
LLDDDHQDRELCKKQKVCAGDWTKIISTTYMVINPTKEKPKLSALVKKKLVKYVIPSCVHRLAISSGRAFTCMFTH